MWRAVTSGVGILACGTPKLLAGVYLGNWLGLSARVELDWLLHGHSPKVKSNKRIKTVINDLFPTMLTKLYSQLYPGGAETSDNIIAGF